MPIEQIDPSLAARRRLENPALILLDCREPDELAICRIEGARHIPMNDVPSRLNQLDPEAEIVVFCHHGARSARVCAFLKEQGFAKVKNLRGGIEAWSVQVDPRVPRY